jgi:DNA-binding NarL/FixJ family response regulator
MPPPLAPPIRILLVEDHGIVRAGLRMLIENWPGQTVVGEAADRAAALALAQTTQPDIILLDIYLRDESGLGMLPDLLRVAPRARVLVLTAVQDPVQHRQAVRLGAMGIVLKEQAASTLAEAITQVYAGAAWLDPRLVGTILHERAYPPAPRAPDADPVPARIALLTDRERAVVACVGEGLPNRQIAARLTISETTVAHHLTAIFSKLAVTSRLELVVLAYRHGLVTPAPSAFTPLTPPGAG